MERDSELHPLSPPISESRLSSDCVPSDSQATQQSSDHQDLCPNGDSSVQTSTCSSDQVTVEKDSGGDFGNTAVVCDSSVTASLQQLASHPQTQDESDEEFVSASDGEGDDDDDNEKLEEWADSLPGWRSHVDIPAPQTSSSEAQTKPCSSPKKTKTQRTPLSDSNSDVNTPLTPNTSTTDGKSEESLSELNSDLHTKLNLETTSSDEKCNNDSSENVSNTLPETSEEELECIMAAAVAGDDDEDDKTDEDEEDEEKAEAAGGDENKDSDKSKEDEKQKEEDEKQKEEEAERKRQEEEDALPEKELQRRLSEAVDVKTKGNNTFKSGQYPEALELYTQGLEICPLKYIHQRAIMLSNRAACRIKEGDYKTAVKDCTKAIECDPVYPKAYFRRADTYEKLEKLEEALQDHKKVLELNPSEATSYRACIRLEKEIQERNEKMKAELIGKLKDLGNMVLNPFGLSTNNFQFQQDPNTGSYSVQFVQNAPTNGR